jgi:hypothetical protein
MNEELENELDNDLRPEYDFDSMAGGVVGSMSIGIGPGQISSYWSRTSPPLFRMLNR